MFKGCICRCNFYRLSIIASISSIGFSLNKCVSMNNDDLIWNSNEITVGYDTIIGKCVNLTELKNWRF